MKGSKARIISPLIKKSGYSQHCLEYAYYMNGEDVGQLNLYIKVGPGIPSTPSRTLIGSWGPFWIKDRITFNLNVQVDFEVSTF